MNTDTVSPAPNDADARRTLELLGVPATKQRDLTYAAVLSAALLATLAVRYHVLSDTSEWGALQHGSITWLLAFFWAPQPLSIPATLTANLRCAWGLRASWPRRVAGLYPFMLRTFPATTVVHFSGFVGLTAAAVFS